MMAIVSVGYDGTVDETQWANLIGKAGGTEYGVDLAGDFGVTPVAGVDRTIRIAPGKAWGHGVLDTMDIEQTIQLDASLSGDRYDMVVLRRDWQPPGGATTIAIVTGSASSLTLPARNTGTLGILDDQPIALIRVMAGSTSVSVAADLRVWGRNGGCVASDDRVLQYLAALGARVTIDRNSYTRIIGVSGAEWQRSYETYGIQSERDLYSMPADVSVGPWRRINFAAGTFRSGSMPNVQMTMSDRVAPYAGGLLYLEHKNVDHTGFEYRAVVTDFGASMGRRDFYMHWLARQ